jgi:thiol-disulfide isomerase/thioredoxin
MSRDVRQIASSRFSRGLFLGMALLGVVGSPPALSGQEETSLLRSGTFTTVTGEVIQTDTLAGRVILVNAWATWCGPCVLEMPGFQRVQDELGEQGFVVIGISVDQEGPEVVRAFVDELGITYPITAGPHHVLGRLAAQVRGLPTSMLLGRDGLLARKVEGVFSEEDLREAVRALLEGETP